MQFSTKNKLSSPIRKADIAAMYKNMYDGFFTKIEECFHIGIYERYQFTIMWVIRSRFVYHIHDKSHPTIKRMAYYFHYCLVNRSISVSVLNNRLLRA